MLYTERWLDINNSRFRRVSAIVNRSKHSVTKAIEVLRTHISRDFHILVLSGVNIVQMTECHVHFMLTILAQQFDGLTIVNLQIHNTTFSGQFLGGNFYLDAFDKNTIISLNMTDSRFNNIHIEQEAGFGYVGGLIENCIFNSSTKRFLLLTTLVIRNCQYILSDSMRGSAIIHVTGNDLLYKEPAWRHTKIHELICLVSDCGPSGLIIIFENITFGGTLKVQTVSIVESRDIALTLRNIVFNVLMKNIKRTAAYIDHRNDKFKGRFRYILSNTIEHVTINASFLNTSLPIFSTVSFKIYFKNFKILCAEGFTVRRVSNEAVEYFSCEHHCHLNAYTFQSGSSVIHGEKEVKHNNINISSEKLICHPCPVGANCTKQIKALPNYWGYKKGNDSSIEMIRCPNGYCCTRNEMCQEINSCNTGRTETLCGKCRNELAEALFSTKCLPKEKCKGGTAFLYYTLGAILY